VGIAHIQPITKIMEIKINSIDNLQIVTLEGDIDSSVASEVTEKIIPLVTEKAKIILDMTAVAYMSSAGLRTLLSIHRQASNSDVPLILVGLSEEIKDTMSVTGFLNFFTVSKSVEDAKSQLLP
jgi:anti-sigma B factor antagonist